MTSYDDIYSQFIIISKTDSFNLPSTIEGQHNAIHSGINHFNSRMRTNITYNDNTETVDKDLTNDELLILTHMMKLEFLNNDLTYTATLLQPFEKEIGIKNLGSQLSAKSDLIKKEKQEIEQLILNQSDDYM